MGLQFLSNLDDLGSLFLSFFSAPSLFFRDYNYKYTGLPKVVHSTMVLFSFFVLYFFLSVFHIGMTKFTHLILQSYLTLRPFIVFFISDIVFNSKNLIWVFKISIFHVSA